MLNRIVLVGRLTRDPEPQRTAKETSVCKFSVAVDDRILKDANGKPETSYINVVAWDKQADNVAKFLRKGALVGVDGRLHQRTYENREGKKVSVFEVIADSVQFLEPKGSREIPNEEIVPDEPIDEESKNLDSIEATDDDLPF